MKERNPIDRHDLRINKSDKVLEVGSGHNPTYRANVIVEKYISSNYHRGGDIKIYPHQKFINADGSSMPFKDKDFDYVICAQVLEHVDDPIAPLMNYNEPPLVAIWKSPVSSENPCSLKNHINGFA